MPIESPAVRPGFEPFSKDSTAWRESNVGGVKWVINGAMNLVWACAMNRIHCGTAAQNTPKRKSIPLIARRYFVSLSDSSAPLLVSLPLSLFNRSQTRHTAAMIDGFGPKYISGLLSCYRSVCVAIEFQGLSRGCAMTCICCVNTHVVTLCWVLRYRCTA